MVYDSDYEIGPHSSSYHFTEKKRFNSKILLFYEDNRSANEYVEDDYPWTNPRMKILEKKRTWL